jgi:hypothetical protein
MIDTGTARGRCWRPQRGCLVLHTGKKAIPAQTTGSLNLFLITVIRVLHHYLVILLGDRVRAARRVLPRGRARLLGRPTERQDRTHHAGHLPDAQPPILIASSWSPSLPPRAWARGRAHTVPARYQALTPLMWARSWLQESQRKATARVGHGWQGSVRLPPRHAPWGPPPPSPSSRGSRPAGQGTTCTHPHRMSPLSPHTLGLVKVFSCFRVPGTRIPRQRNRSRHGG